MSDRTVRWGGAAGVIFVVLILITVFSSGEVPAADDSVDKIRSYFVDHRTALLVSNLLAIVAIPFVVWFAVVLREMLRGDATTNALGTASLAGVLVTVPLALAGGAVATAPVYLDGSAEKLNGDTLRLLYDAQSLLFGATAAGIVLFTVPVALAIRRTGALPTYVMWLAVLAAAGNVVAVFSTLDAGAAFVGFAGITTFALFVLVTGITMAVGKVTFTAPTPRATPTPA